MNLTDFKPICIEKDSKHFWIISKQISCFGLYSNLRESKLFPNLIPNHSGSFGTNPKIGLYLIPWKTTKINPTWSNSLRFNPNEPVTSIKSVLIRALTDSNRIFNQNNCDFGFIRIGPEWIWLILNRLTSNGIQNVFGLVRIRFQNDLDYIPIWANQSFFELFPNMILNYLDSFRINSKNWLVTGWIKIDQKSIQLDPIHYASIQMNPKQVSNIY